MLSFSSYGSAKHDRVTMVADAVKIAKEKYPDITVDGELQLDAALVPEVAALKAPESPVAGKANTLVFPNLEAGNIGYSLFRDLLRLELMVLFFRDFLCQLTIFQEDASLTISLVLSLSHPYSARLRTNFRLVSKG
mgnify:CR=1 FL=1